MDFEDFRNFSDVPKEELTFNKLLDKYLRYYRWYLLSVAVIVSLAFFKLRYEVPKYSATTSILLKEKEKGSSISDLSSFEDLGIFGSGDNSLENEIQILKSRKLMRKVVEELNLNLQVFRESSPYDIELFESSPLVFEYSGDSDVIESLSGEFKLKIVSSEKFELSDSEDTPLGNRVFNEYFTITLGEENLQQKLKVRILKSKNFSKVFLGQTLIIRIRPITSVVALYMSRLEIKPINEKLSKVLEISVVDEVRDKAIVIVNNLIEQYNADGINDNNELAQTTIDFLDLRIALISQELIAIENTAEQFKTTNRMVDVNAGANIFLESSSANESNTVEANTQKQLVDYMLDELSRSGYSALLPSNIGLSDPGIVNMIGTYNDLILQRNRILKSSSTLNPIIVNIDSQLRELRSNLLTSLNNLNSTLEIKINALNNQSGKISARIASMPKNEKEYKNIVRQQEVKNALYLFLLQKREESILSNSVSISKAKLIDQGFSSGFPVSPKKKLILLGAFFLSVLFPTILIYLKDILDTKVHDENDLSGLNIPYLGDVPKATTKKDLYISNNSNSSIAEAFRFLRTNIGFMLDRMDRGRTIFLTSTRSHEGKTFTAINLALSLSISGHKTLLLALDLRAPKINTYMEVESTIGVSNFIKNPMIQVEDLIQSDIRDPNFYLINSGDIPPNPVELLMSKRMDELFEYAKRNFEYVIVDTAPVGMVTDTLQISKFSDLTIYVVKANSLDKRMLHIPEKLNRENKLPNMAILINGLDVKRGGYGYGYGYGSQKKKKWYEKLSFSK
jgi:capsular exopolysaccharide synthesis family protein